MVLSSYMLILRKRVVMPVRLNYPINTACIGKTIVDVCFQKQISKSRFYKATFL